MAENTDDLRGLKKCSVIMYLLNDDGDLLPGARSQYNIITTSVAGVCLAAEHVCEGVIVQT